MKRVLSILAALIGALLVAVSCGVVVAFWVILVLHLADAEPSQSALFLVWASSGTGALWGLCTSVAPIYCWTWDLVHSFEQKYPENA